MVVLFRSCPVLLIPDQDNLVMFEIALCQALNGRDTRNHELQLPPMHITLPPPQSYPRSSLLQDNLDNLVMFEIALCQALNGRDTRNHELQLKTWDGRPMDTLLHIISSRWERRASCKTWWRGGQQRSDYESPDSHTSPSAFLLPLSIPVASRRSPTGEPVGATCFMQDVVERRAAENASAMKMVAEAASQAKTMQLACLCHEYSERLVECGVERRNEELVWAAENACAMKMVAEAASQAKTMQLACLCHEIRNPLNGILSSISFMEGTEMSSDQRDLLHATSACGFMEGTEMSSSDQRDLLHATSACVRVCASLLSSAALPFFGKYLRRVVDNVLDLSKLEEGKLEVESEPFELIHVVDAVIAQLEVESEPFELIHVVDAVIAQLEVESEPFELIHVVDAVIAQLEVESEPFELIHVVDAVIAQLEVESEPFELIHVVDAVIAQEHENASDKGLQVFCSVEPQCADVIVKGDKHRVQQIVTNFFRNAVEYTEQGWVEEHENASDKGLQVFCSVEPQCADVIVKGDKHRVQQIIANFFRNAVEYTERGWVEVQLYKGSGEPAYNEYGSRDAQWEREGGALAGRLMHGQQTGQRNGQDRNVSADQEEMFPFVLCVADSGPGLSEEQRQQVFTGLDPTSAAAPTISSGASDTESRKAALNPGVVGGGWWVVGGGLSEEQRQQVFSGLDPTSAAAPAISSGASDTESRSSAPAGSGLGLIVSQKLASLMSGSLSCASALSQGSSFRLSLSLPFAGHSNHADPADAGAELAAGHASLAPGGMMSCYLSNRVKGVVYTSVGVWSSAEEIAAAPVVPPSLSRSLSASVPARTGSSAAAAAAGASAAAGMVQTGAGLSGAGVSAPAHVTAGVAGMTLTGGYSHGLALGAAAGATAGAAEEGSAHAAAEDADVDTAALAAIVELEAAYGGRVMVQVLREVVDFREVAISPYPLTSPSLHPPSVPALPSSSKRNSAAVSASFSTVSSRSKSLACEPLTFSMRSLRLAIPQAAATTAPVVELAADVAEATSAVEELPLQSAEDIKTARKEEQRRKRLVQKRKLRKKGRWPPSKMKQHQNV
ncbi:unnamed protein product [Closterium sp. Naga37s-1]|nr:unnamed protein product [Closterium sp. Naga37s-1]